MAFSMLRVFVALGLLSCSITPVGARTYGQVFTRHGLRRLTSNSTNSTNNTNSTPAPTPAPTSAPTSAPTPAPTKVTPAAGSKVVKVDVTIKGLDFTKLKGDTALMAKVTSGLESAMATAVGVPPANVKATLSAGSVKASFAITPPAGSSGVTAETISKKVKENKDSTGTSLVAAIKAVPGYDAAVSGTLSAEVSDPVTTTTSANVDGAHRCAASGVGAALLLAMATIAVASPAQ